VPFDPKFYNQLATGEKATCEATYIEKVYDAGVLWRRKGWLDVYKEREVFFFLCRCQLLADEKGDKGEGVGFAGSEGGSLQFGGLADCHYLDFNFAAEIAFEVRICKLDLARIRHHS